MQSFLIFFYLLDMCYNLIPEDDLGGMLGAISPMLWEDGRPMDSSVYNDWKKTLTRVEFNRSNIVKTACSFLEEYERKYGFNFSQTKRTLLSAVDEDILEKAFLYASQMNTKYQYQDYLID